MSADLNPLVADAVFAAPGLQSAEFRSIADGSPPVVISAQVVPIRGTNELVFVDAATPDYQRLIESMREGTPADGRQLEFVIIDAERDGIRKITDTLAGRSGLDAIHIISHAGDGAVQLGSAKLDFDSLLERSAAIKKWGAALGENGDLLLYGCNLAATAEGKSLLDALARLTGADVAASDDFTGAASKGGDWDLEFRTGSVDADVLGSAGSHDLWDNLLATFTVANTNDAGLGSLRQAIIDANAAAGADTIAFNIGAFGSVQTIAPASALPTITDPVLLDGRTQGGVGYTGPPLIELDGSSAGVANGLVLDSNGSTVRGLVINRFSLSGIALLGDGNVVAGNYLGTDVTGQLARGNAIDGVEIFSSGNVVGGAAVADRNVISGNLDDGVNIDAAAAVGNVVLGNYIGLDATGSFDLGNASDGVLIENGAAGNTVGGAAANVISGNNGAGVQLAAGAMGNRVEGNRIHANTGDGVLITAAATNSILGNSMHSNGGLGIDLGGDGVSANDAGDGDVGANNLQNHPVLATANVLGADISISGTLDSTGARTFRIEFFASSAADPTGRGEGQRYLGFTDVTVAGGPTGFSTTFTPAIAVAAGELISATATDLTSTETSEFAPCVTATAAPVAVNDGYTLTEDSTLTVGWWDTDWSRRRQITFNNTNVGGFAPAETLSNFPVLLVLDSTNVDYTLTQADGGDLRFFDADGTPLAYEIERWDETGSSYVWVKVPQIDIGATDSITMYYGNAGVADGADPSAVWAGTGYRSVYHLDDVGPTVEDATSTNYDGTATNGATGGQTGQIGSAYGFDATNDYIDLGDDRSFIDGASAATFSAWVNPANNDGVNPNIILSASVNNGGAPSGNSRMAIELDPFGDVKFIVRSDDSAVATVFTTGTPVAAGTWHYVTGVVDVVTNTITVYVDGVARPITPGGPYALPGTAFPNSASASASIGSSDEGAGPHFDGRIDEARIAAAARTAGWIQAEYRAMSNQAGTEFVAFGAAQAAPALGGVLNNDTDAEGNRLGSTLVTNVSNGTLTLNGDGTFVYTPNPDFFGTDTFTYRANDGALDSNVATVTITVTPVNDAPVATGDAHAVNEDATLNIPGPGVLGNDIDIDGPALSAVLVAGPSAAAAFTLNADGSFSYTPTVDFSGVDAFTYRVFDGTLQSGVATVTLTVNAVNDPPVIGPTGFTVADGGTAGIGTGNLSVTDADDAATSLVFTVGTLANGRFELVSAPGVAIASFTQHQIVAGEVRFVHDGSGTAPTVTIYVSDGTTGVGPHTLNVAFTAGVRVTGAPGGGGSNSGGAPTITPPAPEPAPAPAPAPQAQPGSAQGPGAQVQAFLRSPTTPAPGGGGEGRETEVSTPVTHLPAGATQSEKPVTLDAPTSIVRAESDSKPLGSEIEVEPIRAEMQVLPTRHDSSGNPDDEERRAIEVTLSSVRITGLAMSVGAVWWAARAAGLIASVLASSPAWRHVDPLPVLGRDDDEEDQWDDAEGDDQDRKDEEHRAAWVLDDREAR